MSKKTLKRAVFCKTAVYGKESVEVSANFPNFAPGSRVGAGPVPARTPDRAFVYLPTLNDIAPE